MSRINDALKQARQTPTPKTGTAPTALPPVETRRTSWHSIFLVPLMLALVAAGGWCWLKWWEGQVTDRRVSQPISISAHARVKLTADATPALTNPPRQLKLAIIPLAGTNDSNHASAVEVKHTHNINTAATIPAAARGSTNPVAVVLPPAFPVLKLQGIFYSVTRPSAFINNQAVFVGEKISQARVIAIGRQEVIVSWNGQSKALSLEPDR